MGPFAPAMGGVDALREDAEVSFRGQIPTGQRGSRRWKPESHKGVAREALIRWDGREGQQWGTLLEMMVGLERRSWAGHPMGQTREPRLASKDGGKLFVDLACKQPRLY